VVRTDESSGRRFSGRTLLNLVIIALAVIGVVSILGWVVSAFLWLVRLAAVVVAVAVVLVLVKLAVQAGRDPR
jgi:hypothetical protein